MREAKAKNKPFWKLTCRSGPGAATAPGPPSPPGAHHAAARRDVALAVLPPPIRTGRPGNE